MKTVWFFAFCRYALSVNIVLLQQHRWLFSSVALRRGYSRAVAKKADFRVSRWF